MVILGPYLLQIRSLPPNAARIGWLPLIGQGSAFAKQCASSGLGRPPCARVLTVQRKSTDPGSCLRSGWPESHPERPASATNLSSLREPVSIGFRQERTSHVRRAALRIRNWMASARPLWKAESDRAAVRRIVERLWLEKAPNLRYHMISELTVSAGPKKVSGSAAIFEGPMPCGFPARRRSAKPGTGS